MKKNSSRITRRGFIKTGAAALTAATVGVNITTDNEVLAATSLGQDKYQDREVDSCCQFCQVRCTTKVQVKDGKVVNVYGNPDNFWTRGSMCPKGKSMVELSYSPQRILYPMLKENGSWRRIPYSQAVELVAEKIQQVKREHPEDFTHRVAMFAPLWESRESELAALMALHLAGFPDICSPGDTCIGNTSTTMRIILGSYNSPTTLDEILETETLVLFGTNISEMYPPYMRWLRMARDKGVKIIYIDPRRTPTRSFCDLHYRTRPGTDGALALGIVNILIQKNFYEVDYVASQVNGFAELKEAAAEYTPEKVEELTWVPAGQVIELAQILGKSKRTMVWLGGSISRYTNSMQTVRNIIGIQAITNNLIGTGKGLMNVQGGKPGGDEEFLEHYKAPDIGARLKYRKVSYNMKKDRLDVLLLNSSYRRYPDLKKLKKRIKKVKFVVYRGFFMDEEAELADLIIPGTMVFESEGSQYGAQRQVVWRNKVVERPGETTEDWRFYRDLGKKLAPEKYPDVNSAAEIYELFRKQVHSWHGLTLDRVKASPTGITWPCFSESEPDTRGSIFRDGKFGTEDGKVQLSFKPLGRISWHEPKGSPLDKKNKDAKKFPLIFIQGKVVEHWQHTYTNWSKYMGQFSGGNFVQLHPDTAGQLKIQDGEKVFIETKVGRLEAVARVTDSVMKGTVFTPSHPAPANPVTGNKGTSVNTIVPGYWDKVSAQFNGFGCRIVKV